MKRKVFCSITGKAGGIGVAERDGFEIEVNGKIFNAYCSNYKTVQVIDPETGGSVFRCNMNGRSEINAIREAREKLKQEKDIMRSFEKYQKTEEYKMFLEIFRLLNRCWELKNRQNKKIEKTS